MGISPVHDTWKHYSRDRTSLVLLPDIGSFHGYHLECLHEVRFYCGHFLYNFTASCPRQPTSLTAHIPPAWARKFLFGPETWLTTAVISFWIIVNPDSRSPLAWTVRRFSYLSFDFCSVARVSESSFCLKWGHATAEATQKELVALSNDVYSQASSLSPLESTSFLHAQGFRISGRTCHTRTLLQRDFGCKQAFAQIGYCRRCS